MKFRGLGEWVGLKGTTLRRRAKVLGHNFNLEDSLTVAQANKLYRELPVEKVMTVTYVDARKPKVEFVGPWNINDWHRLFKKIQHAIMLRNRDFSRAARKNGQQPKPVEIPVDQPVSIAVESAERPVPQADLPVEVVEAVSSIAALVEIDAQVNKNALEEYDHARKPGTSHPRTSAISDNSSGIDAGEPAGAGRTGSDAGSNASPE